MLRPLAIALIAILFSLTAVAILGISIPKGRDGRRYRELMQQTVAQKEELSVHKQERKGVRKDLVISRPTGRYQAILTCPKSELTLTKEASNSEVVEVMPRFQCVMQEEVKAPHQVVREFHAADGTFFYQRQLMNAEQVAVSRYLAEGETLPIETEETKLLMKGFSKSANLYFGSGFRFQAHQLKATFFGDEEE